MCTMPHIICAFIGAESGHHLIQRTVSNQEMYSMVKYSMFEDLKIMELGLRGGKGRGD